MNEIIGEYERYPFPFDSKLGLKVSKNMPKIYVKELKKEKKVKINLSSEIYPFSYTATEHVTPNVTLQNLWFQPFGSIWFQNTSRFKISNNIHALMSDHCSKRLAQV